LEGADQAGLGLDPVEIFSATKSGASIAFNQIHEPTGQRIKYEKGGAGRRRGARLRRS
jgi:non-homologous end joining protein Ku